MPFIICITIQVIAFFKVKDNPQKTLKIFSILGAIAMIFGIFSSGKIALFSFFKWRSMLFYNVAMYIYFKHQRTRKIHFSRIFFFNHDDLRGAIIPPLQGKIADLIGIQNSYLITIFCFIYLIYFSVKMKKIFQ